MGGNLLVTTLAIWLGFGLSLTFFLLTEMGFYGGVFSFSQTFCNSNDSPLGCKF